jgi:hypothetical protein
LEWQNLCWVIASLDDFIDAAAKALKMDGAVAAPRPAE